MIEPLAHHSKCLWPAHSMPLNLRHTVVPSRLACIADYHYDSSAIIEDIERISKIGTAHVAYFFDFKDTGKQDARAFLSSILVQLSKQSASL